MNCSIIIPTYNRPDYLKRLLSYYNSCNIEYKIIIADSSSDENKAIDKKIVQSFQNLDILHISDYPVTINPLNKFLDSINYVKSRYCLFCADDDFITPNGIDQSVDFLEKNQDYSVAHGIYACFRINEKKNKPNLLWKLCYPPESITFLDPKDRFYHHFANYSFPTFYGVHRTDLLKMILEETIKYTDDVRFGELLPTLITSIYGKIKCLNMIYAARDSSSVSNYYPGFNDYIKEGTYNRKYFKFQNCLVNHLNINSNLDPEELKKIVDAAMSDYLGKTKKSLKMTLIDRMKLPNSIDKKIRSIYEKLFSPNKWTDLTTFIEKISIESDADLNIIHKNVSLFYDAENADNKNRN